MLIALVVYIWSLHISCRNRWCIQGFSKIMLVFIGTGSTRCRAVSSNRFRIITVSNGSEGADNDLLDVLRILLPVLYFSLFVRVCLILKVIDQFQLMVSANKALHNHRNQKLTTKNLHSELLFCMSPTRSVSFVTNLLFSVLYLFSKLIWVVFI